MPSIHAALEIIPELFDGVEVRAPSRPVNEVDAVIVEPDSTCASSVWRCVVLLKPPLAARPELMGRGDEIQAEDGLIAARIKRLDVELRVAQSSCADAAP